MVHLVVWWFSHRRPRKVPGFPRSRNSPVPRDNSLDVPTGLVSSSSSWAELMWSVEIPEFNGTLNGNIIKWRIFIDGDVSYVGMDQVTCESSFFWGVVRAILVWTHRYHCFDSYSCGCVELQWSHLFVCSVGCLVWFCLFVYLFVCLLFVGLLVCLFVCLFRWSMVDVASDLGWFHSDSFDSSCFPVSCRILQSSLDAFWGSIWPNWPQALINLSRVCRGTEKNMLANTSASSCNPLQIGFGTS